MTEVLERALGGQGGPARLLEALRWPDADGGADHVRLFPARGAGADTLRLNGADRALQVQTVKSVSKGLVVAGRIAPEAPVVLDMAAGDTQTVACGAPEPALFRGLHCAFVQRNGEHIEVVLDWLRYHARGHDVQAVLILDRARRGKSCARGLRKALETEDIPGLQRIVVLTSPVPLGTPGLPAESHPLNAPDAPGKDRMEKVAPDPWAAPLGEMTIFEIVRWRFLGQARAVLSLEMTDLMVPVSGPSAMRRAVASECGVVALLGRRVYPWRVRVDGKPGFGDHVCDQFDGTGGNRRWVLAPARIADSDPWRLVRVGAIDPDPAQAGYFYRCMAVRAPQAAAAELVPKTSLVLDAGLLALARDTFGADPVLPPEAAPHLAPAIPANMPGRTAIVTCMKNEGPFILEWLAYHRAIGVDDFLVYTNDCTDGTDTMLDLLQAHGVLQHRDNPFREMEMKPQHAALAAAEAEPVMHRAGWGICMDVDEFINVHVGAGHLRDLYDAVGNANMISCTWRLFGNSDLHTFEDIPTIERFDRCAPKMIRKPHQAWGFKTLFRNIGIFKKMGVHRPKGLKPELWEQIIWVNGSGRAMPRDMLRNGWRSTVDSVGYDMVTLNHYAVRDAESFLVKRDRGRVNHVERDQGLGYWFRMNNNAVADTSIQRMVPEMLAELEGLMSLEGVSEQHIACVAAHRARIAALRAGDAFAAFYTEITGAKLEAVSRMHAHFGSNVFLAGPDIIPDSVAFGTHAPEFFFTVEEVDETIH